jgi:beta-phosphoglucomutase-like phosphatase (HAD superfamily)
LYSKKVPLAVTTSAGREGTLLILSKAGIDKMFDVIITRDDCEKLKPDPEPYIVTAKKLQIEPKFCVAIEDTSLGVESAKGAGMLCIAIPNEFTRDQDFSMADVVVKSANEVEDILEFIL